MSQGSRDELPISIVTMMSVLAKRVLLSTPPPPPGAPPRAARREDSMMREFGSVGRGRGSRCVHSVAAKLGRKARSYPTSASGAMKRVISAST